MVVAVFFNGLDYEKAEIIKENELLKREKEDNKEYKAGRNSWRRQYWQVLFQGTKEECEKYIKEGAIYND